MTKLALLLLAVVVPSTADIVFDNELIKTDEIFDLDNAKDSNVSKYDSVGQNTSYYCVFRSNWNTENHPAEYPELARWGNPLIFSHTKQYAPFIKDRAAPYGVEQIAEYAFTDIFKTELQAAGELVKDSTEGKGFFVDQKKWDENFVYLPPIQVTAEESFLSGIAGLTPSPDWFSGFYLFDTLKEDTQNFWESFLILTYPWDAGTDDGTTYTAGDRDTDPAGLVTRIDVGNTNGDIFKSPTGDKVRHVAEWECVLHTCPPEDPACSKADWPPANGCDILRFPECAMMCDPAVDTECEQCKRENSREEQVFHKSCCLAGREPKDGTCNEDAPASGGVSLSIAASMTVVVLGLASLLE